MGKGKGKPVRWFSRPSPYRTTEDDKKWEEVRCPICMEHPHNAVLLKCSSHDKGCRPYMCDTSRRHSNCLDQFLNSSSSSQRCPLCRGAILGYSASPSARARLDPRPRSCSTEGCGFSGSYPELRQHARSDHPSTRPREVEPTTRLEWTRLEHERDRDDVLSLVSAFGHNQARAEPLMDEWVLFSTDDGDGPRDPSLSQSAGSPSLFYCHLCGRIH